MAGMKNHRIYSMSFASVYPLYVTKAERKGRTQTEVDEIICWLTGYSKEALVHRKLSFLEFLVVLVDSSIVGIQL